MQFALVNNQRVEAFPGAKGLCLTCGSEMIAKCGPRNINHWAHHGRINCDPWWENETPWHRAWKNKFPADCREASHTADNGEIHRADIKTPTGIVIELQHLNITDAERISREKFYRNLVWVIDGLEFQDNFDIYHMLPIPDSELAKDLVWIKAKRHMNGANCGLFLHLSEARDDNSGITKATLRSGWIHGIDEIENELNLSYNGYHQYNWVRPRKTWLDASCPVYIYFGDEYLVKLDVYGPSELKYAKLVSKIKLVHDVMVEKDVRDIAICFYPIGNHMRSSRVLHTDKLLAALLIYRPAQR